MDRRIINLYDQFTHGGMTRRAFLDRLADLAGSAAAGAALLPLLQNNYAQAAIVEADDARLATERVSYDLPNGKINGYLVRAKAEGSAPPSSRSTRTAASIRISRMSPGASRWKVSWRSRPTCCRWSAAHRRAKTRRASCIPR